MRPAALSAVALVLALSACGTGDPVSLGSTQSAVPSAVPSTDPSADQMTSPSPTTSPSAQQSPSPATQRCTHAAEGYSVAFPAGWFVAEAEGIEPCTFFHPAPLTLPEAGEATGVAIRADVREVPLTQARQDSLSEGDQTAKDLTVAGRRAVRLEGVLTEEGLLPAGTRVTTWLVQLGDRTLVLTTDSAGEDDYATAVGVLDAMAQSLQGS